MTPQPIVRWHKKLPMPLSKLIGGWFCLRECGWHYTWHHFWGKVGRRLKAFGVMKGFADALCAYAYELHYYQFRSLDELSAVPPAYGCDAVSGVWRGRVGGASIRRVAVIALYSADGRISDAQVELVRGVAKAVDRTVVCGDCLLPPDEVRKLLPFAALVFCERHGEYDFGSYRRGFARAKQEGWLDGEEFTDLVLVNDASFGPVYPLEEAFRRMDGVPCDFWGQTSYEMRGCRHVQSFFYVFRRRVILSGAVGEFLDTVGGRKSRQDVIDTYELGFTRFLEAKGFSWRTLVPYGKVPYNPTTRPLTLLTKHHVPFVKRKAMIGECDEDPRLTIRKIARVNAPLAEIIRADTLCLIYGDFEISVSGGDVCRDGVKLVDQPEFSVVLPTYNRAHCIRDAIDSLLRQTYRHFQLIVVDDGSTDGTEEMIRKRYGKELSASRMVYLRGPNDGVSRARNAGLEEAKGDWIAYLDSDNVVRETFLETFVRGIAANPGRMAFYARQRFRRSGQVGGRPFDLRELERTNFIDLGVYTHARQLYDESGGFDEKMTRLVDWELVVRYSKSAEPLFINRVVMDYSDDPAADRISTKADYDSNLAYLRAKHCSQTNEFRHLRAGT